MKYLLLSTLITCLIILSSCQNEEGIGGSATITGKVSVQLFDKNTGALQGQYDAPEERVYIVYGDNNIYDDDTRTHHDGNYQFQNLFEGNYTIYAYSECRSCLSGVEPVSIKVNISGGKQTITADSISIRKFD